jgi:hypothetical protein
MLQMELIEVSNDVCWLLSDLATHLLSLGSNTQNFSNCINRV